MNHREGLDYLAGLTQAAVESSRVKPGEKVGAYPGNTLGHVLIRPGGRACYPAVWVQDYYMSLDTGFVTLEEATNHLLLIARGQNGSQGRQLKSGGYIPPFAIPDHITFDGKPVYYPGTYSSGEDQGGEPWGICPPINNYFDFIAIAHYVCKTASHARILRQDVDGLALIDRLRKAFAVPEHDSQTGLITITPERRAVGFIFCDSIYMTGTHLMASLLRRRAALHLAELEKMLHANADVHLLIEEAQKIQNHLHFFRDPDRCGGWLFAASDVGHQADVWGTLYALMHKLLSPQDHAEALAQVVQSLEDGTILSRGAVRHVPTDRNARADSAWERTHTPFNCYQNGAYWYMPTGWLVAALWPTHPDLAERIFSDMVTALQEEDFRKGPEFNAPWESISPDKAKSSCPVFLASVTVPYATLRQLWSSHAGA